MEIKKKYWKYLLITLFIPLIIQGCSKKNNNDTIDVIVSGFEIEKTDSLIVEQLIERSKSFYNENQSKNEIFDSFLKEALHIAEQHNIIYYQSVIHNIIGIRNRYAFNFTEALKSHQQAYKLAQEINNEQLITEISNQLGTIARRIDNSSMALEMHVNALNHAENLNDSFNISIAYNGIGNVNHQLGRYHTAIEYFNRALNISEKLNNIRGKAINNNNIGECWLKLGDPDSALFYQFKSLDYNNQINNIAGIAICYKGISAAFIAKKNLKSALLYIEKAIEINDEHENLLELSSNLIIKGEIFFQMKDYDEVLNNTSKALKIVTKIDSKRHIEETFRIMAMVYEEKRIYSLALYYFKQASNYREAIVNEKNINHLNTMETILESDAQKQKILELINEKNQKDIQLIRQRMILTIFVISSLIIILATTMLIFQIRLRNKYNTLKYQQRLLRTQMNPHFIFNALSAIQVYVLENNVESTIRYLKDFSKLMRQILQSSNQNYILLSEEIEIITYYINLQRLRFIPAFKFSLEIDKNILIDKTIVPPMIMQPFVENAIEHGINEMGEEGNISISYKKVDKQIVMEVDDNGIGINESSEKSKANKNHESLAIKITRKRLDIIKKETKEKTGLEIIDKSEISPFSRGTKVKIILPLIEEKK